MSEKRVKRQKLNIVVFRKLQAQENDLKQELMEHWKNKLVPGDNPITAAIRILKEMRTVMECEKDQE